MSANPSAFLPCREKKNRPLKNPLKELVVVHTDKEFLADIEGDCNLYQTYGHVNGSVVDDSTKMTDGSSSLMYNGLNSSVTPAVNSDSVCLMAYSYIHK